MKRSASWSPEGDEEDSEQSEDSCCSEEDDSRDLVCQEILAGIGAYEYAVKLRRHGEFEQAAMNLAVDILHGDSAVGSLSGMLIDRCVQPHFHEICDAESQELNDSGFFFCDAEGQVRYADIDFSEDEDFHTSSGGFLHIDMVQISKQHRHRDLGAHCIKTVLEWLNVRDERKREERRPAGEPAYVEMSCLHSGWTLAVLTAALEALGEFGLATIAALEAMRENRSQPDPESGTPEYLAEAAREAEAALRKATMQWARHGFRQACFGSEFCFFTPKRLDLRSRKEVAGLPRPLHAVDKPLAEYLRQCGVQGLPATWEADVRGHVARGADVARMHALHFAVLNGATTDAQVCLLLGLRADVNGQDAAGCTALHLIAKEASAVEAARALLARGASRSITDLSGNTPLDAVLKKIRFLADRDGSPAMSRILGHHGTCDDWEEQGYELALELLEAPDRAALLEGVLTPRQLHRMRWNAVVQDDMASDLKPLVPLRSEDIDMPYWDYIPRKVRGEQVFKSFVVGWACVLRAMSDLIDPDENRQPQLPSVEAVTKLARCHDDRCVTRFLRRGGRVEFALDALVQETTRFDAFFDLGYDQEEEYKALPTHPFDEQWGFVRYRLLGPRGRVQKGPY